MRSICCNEIYLVDFSPSFGHEYQKIRPAIIISSNELLKRSHLLTCIAVTSKTGNFVKGDDVILRKNSINNLATDSVIKMHHICTFDKKRVHKYIGKLEESAIKEIKKKLKQQFDL